MENKDEKKSKNHTVFSNLNFVKNNKINYNYLQCINKMNNVTNKLENLIDIIDNSIGKDKSKRFRKTKFNENQKRPISAQIIRKPNKLFSRKESKKESFNSSLIITNNNNYDKSKKKKYKLKISKSMILNKSKKFNEHNYRKINYYKYGSNTQNSSIITGTIRQKNERKLNRSNFRKDFSIIHKVFNSNTSTNKINNSSMITVCYPNYYTTKNKRPQSATINRSSLKRYTFKKYNYKNISSYNSSKNFSHSHYRTLTNIYFENINYSKLKPQYLMNFLHDSSNIKNSYKKDLKDIHMKKQTQDMMKIAKKEIDMKDPEYHKKQIFKNIIRVKKTLKYVKKMRYEQKYNMEYYGPGNINNKGYIRKKNANLIRFCDQICHMKDEKFYMYQKLLNELYPNLLKNAVKIKYKMSERDPINEQKMEANLKKIYKLIAIIKKH